MFASLVSVEPEDDGGAAEIPLPVLHLCFGWREVPCFDNLMRCKPAQGAGGAQYLVRDVYEWLRPVRPREPARAQLEQRVVQVGANGRFQFASYYKVWVPRRIRTRRSARLDARSDEPHRRDGQWHRETGPTQAPEAGTSVYKHGSTEGKDADCERIRKRSGSCARRDPVLKSRAFWYEPPLFRDHVTADRDARVMGLGRWRSVHAFVVSPNQWECELFPACGRHRSRAAIVFFRGEVHRCSFSAAVAVEPQSSQRE